MLYYKFFGTLNQATACFILSAMPACMYFVVRKLYEQMFFLINSNRLRLVISDYIINSTLELLCCNITILVGYLLMMRPARGHSG